MITFEDEIPSRDVLIRFSPLTRQAAHEFRRTGDPNQLSVMVHALIEHCVDGGGREKLNADDDQLRLVEDLGIDSLTMLEIVFLAEEVFEISISSEEIRLFRTVGDIKRFITETMEKGESIGRA